MKNIISAGLIPIYAFIAISSLIFSSAVSADITGEQFSVNGNVEVYKKGGKKRLRNFNNTVVFLEGNSDPALNEFAEVDQKRKKFNPRILPVVKGQVVRFYNRDRVEHNVFSTEEKNSFDLGRYPKEDYRDRRYNETGLYKIYCNIHKAMILDVLVVPNRYFARTDKKGNFVISGVPAGEYTLKAWHIYGGSYEMPITVSNDLRVENVSLISTRVVREIKNHLNKSGEKYRNTVGSRY